MCELRHVIGLVKLGRIDLINRIGINLLLGAIVTLHQYLSLGEIFYDPASDESCDGVSEPDIAFAGEVVLALYNSAQTGSLVVIFGDELRSKGAARCAVTMRVGA